MTFAHPWFLLLLLAVPVLVWLRYRRGRRLTFPFSDPAVLKGLPPTWAERAHRLLPWLYAAGLVLLIVALARPQRGLEESRVRTEAVDIVLVIDVSPSMEAEDFSTAVRRMNRLDAAKQVIEAFVAKRESDRIGAIVFARLPYTLAPLTLDHAWLMERIGETQVKMLGDATGIGDALGSAVNRLRRSAAKSKVIVLLTDGMNNVGTLKPEEAAEAAKALGVRIYAVGAGTRGHAPVPVNFFGQVQYVRQPVEIDEDLLQRVARGTGGEYFRATDMETLGRIYDQIDTMEKTEIEVEQFTRFEERFAGWLAAGLVFLAVEKLLATARLGGLPA